MLIYDEIISMLDCKLRLIIARDIIQDAFDKYESLFDVLQQSAFEDVFNTLDECIAWIKDDIEMEVDDED